MGGKDNNLIKNVIETLFILNCFGSQDINLINEILIK